MSRIARSTFNGSPQDNLATVDVYGEVDSSVRNDFTSQFTAFSASLKERLGGTREELRTAIRQGRNLRTNLINGRDRVKAILSGSRSELNSLSDDILRGIEEATGNDNLSKLRVNIGNAVRTLDPNNFQDARGVMRMMQDLTGNDIFETLDLGAEVSLISVALEELSYMGAPELVDDVLDYFDNDEAKRQAVMLSASQLARKADMDSIEKIIDKVGGSALMAETPDFPQQLLQRFTLPRGKSVGDYPVLITQFVKVLDALDINWLYTQRNGVPVYNLKIIHFASDDAVKLFSTVSEYRIPFLTAPEYPERRPSSLMRAMYPLIAIAS